MADRPPMGSVSDSMLLVRIPIAHGDLKALLVDLKTQLQEQATSLIKMSASPEVAKAQQALLRIQSMMPRFESAVESLARERQALQALYEVGQAVNSSLDLPAVLNRVMDQIIQQTGAERSFLMLKDETTGTMEVRAARNVDKESLERSEFNVSKTIIAQVVNDRRPVATTNAQADPRFASQESVVAYSLRSILCVPMLVRDQVTGVIYADNRIKTGLFGDKDRDLLAALANQAALAIENARLFERVKQQLDAITLMKDLMDNVFDSITSGVITTDMNDQVTLFNHAAETILGMQAGDTVNRPYGTTLPIAGDLISAIDEVKQFNKIVSREVERDLPMRGRVELSINFAPLKGASATDNHVSGVALVVDDLTEKRKLEADQRFIKDTFMRYAPPAVVEQILRDPSQLKLGGERKFISIIFCDIRGFTHFSEHLAPEALVETLNHYLGLAADAMLAFDGTLDKFMGDAVMGLFNVPLEQSDHTLRAVKAALKMQQDILEHHKTVRMGEQLDYGVGINVGDAVVGNIGTDKQRNYSAIGDSVNYAKRLQENAKGGQILLSQSAYEVVKANVEVKELPPLQVKGRSVPEPVYEVIGLK